MFELFKRSKKPCTMPALHFKCRNSRYERDDAIERFPVPDEKTPWSVPYPEYSPIDYTHPKIFEKADSGEADPVVLHKIKFNQIDNKLNRISYTGPYTFSEDGYPLNPVGRTGLIGRGALRFWGPNHAADPIVTRWKRDATGKKIRHPASKKPILQFVSIERGHSKQWAIPGGMVDCGEQITSTLKREFAEEALDSTTKTPEELQALKNKVDAAFQKGEEVFRGYVDDPRNTDYAWMETVAVNFHDGRGDCLGMFELTAGDDAIGVKWADMDSTMPLYASHAHFIEKTAKMRKAHW